MEDFIFFLFMIFLFETGFNVSFDFKKCFI